MGNKEKAAAEATGAADIASIEAQTEADRPDQFNALGSQTWTQDADGKWTQQQTLSEGMQGLYDSDINAATTMGTMRDRALGRSEREMAAPLNWEQFGSAEGLKYNPTELRQRAEDASYNRATSRLDPQFAQRATDNEIDLRNKGLRPGDEAYDRAMGNFTRGRNDAYEQARSLSVGEGRTEAGQLFDQQVTSTDMSNALRDKKIEEYLGKRNFSLNEANALDPSANVAAINQNYGS